MNEKRQIIEFTGVSKSFVDVFNAPSKCNNSVGFRILADGSFLAKGLASVETQLYKFWEYSLADVFENTKNFEKDLIINLYDSSKFRSTLNYFDSKFDMVITADWDSTFNAYVAKKLTVKSSTLTIEFACAELVLGYTDYTEELKNQKTSMSNKGEDFVLTSNNLNRLIKLCNLGTFVAEDTTLNIEATDEGLVAYNQNFRNIVDVSFAQRFKRISIKSNLLSVLDVQFDWDVSYDRLQTGGTKWVFVNDEQTITTIVGGLVHEDENENVDSAQISDKFNDEFSSFINE